MLLSQAQLQQLIDECRSQVTPEVTVVSSGLSEYPYVDSTSGKGRISAAFIAQVEHLKPAGKKCQHTVAFIYFPDKDKVNLVCGDKFLEGTLGKSATETRIQQSVEGSGGVTPSLHSALIALSGAYPSNDNCDFPALSKAGTLCLHAKKVMASVKSASDLFTRLKARHQSVQKSCGQSVLGAAATADAPSFLETYAFKVPVLYEGEQGSGKTWEAMEFAKAKGLPLVLIGGNAGLEAADLLGYNVPYKTGELVWKDGPMARAFRMAENGEQVILLFDEIARIPAKQLSLLLTALTPFDGLYRLPTGRMLEVINGVGEEEVLQCPVANLCVIGTTNVGAEFLVEDLDPAILERFVIRRKDTEISKLKEILQAVVQKRAYPPSVVDGLIAVYQQTLRMKAAGTLQRTPSTRIFVRSIELSNAPKDIKSRLQDHALLWVGRNLEGRPIPEQLSAISQLLREKLP